MARKLVVELIADPRGYTAGLQTAAKETKLFGAEMDKATRGILSGTGAIHGLGRSLAFASGGFLAFAGASKFLEDSVSAARDAGVAQRSLAAQIKASGESFTANQAAIEKASLSVEKFGFTSEESEKALTVLERGTGSITRAISLQGVAADLARAKNIDLASAANVVAKVFGGQETALRRAVPGLDKNAHGLQLIAEAQQRLAGQAKAGTTEAERFHAILHNTEVIIGTALLPTLNHFLGSLGKWLDKMNRSGQLQKDVNEAVKTATGLFEGALAVVKPLAAAFQDLGKAVGGAKNEAKLLIGVFAAFKFTRWVSGLTQVGAAASTSAGEVTALRVALGRLAGIGLITIPIEILLNKGPIDKFMSKLFGEGPLSGPEAQAQLGKIAETFGAGFAAKVKDYLAKNADKGFGLGNLAGLVTRAQAGAASGLAGLGRYGVPSMNIPGGAYGNVNAPLSAAQQRAIGLAGDPQNLALLRQQAQADQAALEFAKKLRSSGRISNQKYVQEVTAYASDLQQTNSTINGILSAARQKVADAAKAAAEKRQQAAEQARQAAEAARQNEIAAANLAIQRAQAIPGYQDDLATQERLVQILRRQLAADQTNVGLQQQLFDAEQAVNATLKARAEQASQAKIDAGNLAILRAQLTDSLADDLAAAQKQVGILRAQHASEQDIVSAQLALKGVRDQIAQQRQQAAQQAHDNAVAAAQAAKSRADAAKQTQQHTAEVGIARAGLTKTLTDDIAANQRYLSLLRHQHADELTIIGVQKTIQDLRLQQAQDAADAAKKAADLAKKASGDQTKFRHISSTAFVDSLGLNLTRAQRRAIEAQFTTVGAGGTVPGTHSTQFGAGITIHGGLHVHGVQDVAGLENQIVKRAKARAHTRRGA